MDITKSEFIAFAYTIKALGAVDGDHDYSLWFEKLKKFDISVEYKIAERDSLGKVHYHGIIYLPKGFFRKRLMMKGFHIKLVELYDRSGWVKYIMKDVELWRLDEHPDPDDSDELIEDVPQLSPTIKPLSYKLFKSST